MLKEIGIGLSIGIFVILALQGFNILPVLFIGIIFYFMIGMWGHKGFKDILKKKNDNRSIPEVKFSHVGGQDTAIKELQEALNFINQADKIKDLGIRPLKGILLSGPPGTGKTMLAKAAARYTDSVFVSASGSEFIEMYAGLGAKRIRELFDKAHRAAKDKKKESAIVFIDEIDIVGGKRGQVQSHLEYDQTLNQLLVEMDGLTLADEVRILIMATTNRIDILDKALLRPGRFDRIVNVDLPPKDGRYSILKIHTKDKPLSADVDLEQIAKETFRFSGAHLENLTNEAAVMALREDKNKIYHRHFEEAVEKVIMGEKLARKPESNELKRVAIHETAHAFVGEILDPGSVAAVTITSRGRALGYVRHGPREDMFLQTENYLKDQICISIAGAVAEDIMLSSKSTGAAGDFKKALKMVRKIIEAGMSDLGVVDIESTPENILFDEQKKILNELENKVIRMIKNKQDLLLEISNILLDKERIGGKELRELIVEHK